MQDVAKTNFIATISHELKTPITIIKGQVESMILGIGRYKDTREVLPETLKEIERMEQLVKERRLTERELLAGDKNSYIIEHNGHGRHKVEVVVLCILPDLFGDLADWRFVDPEPMHHKLNMLIRDHGHSDGNYGRNVI